MADDTIESRESEDISLYREQCVELCDELLETDQTTPQDLYFIFTLLRRYHQTSDDNYVCRESTELAWDLAMKVAKTYEEETDLGWVNMYSIIQGFYEMKLEDWAEFPSVERENTSGTSNMFESELDDSMEGVERKLIKTATKIENLEKTYIIETSEGEFEQDPDSVLKSQKNSKFFTLQSLHDMLACSRMIYKKVWLVLILSIGIAA